jgi:hypothetical protein
MITLRGALAPLRRLAGTEGVPPANAPQARNFSEPRGTNFSRFALIAGGSLAVPANHSIG